MSKGRPAPGPKGGFVLGSTFDFKDRPLRFIEYLHKAYGDTTQFRVAGSRWHLVTHPEDIHDMMTTRAHIFLKPKVAKRLWDAFLGDGLLTTEGEVWKRLSRLARPAFHRDRIRAYGEIMVDYTNRMLDGWTEGETRDFDEEMVGLTLEIVGKTLFDEDIRHGAETIGTAMHVVQRELINHVYFPMPKWWPGKRNREKFAAIADIETIVMNMVEARRSTGEDRGDLLSMLVHARDEDGTGMTDRELRDQAMTLIFAGHETTAHALTWAWYLLATHPEVTARIRADMHAVAGDSRLEVSHLTDLPYLEQVTKESLRILPSVWVFMKEPNEDVLMRDGIRIPKGTQVMISPYVTHHDARWFPSPETFDPDRWTKERAATIPKGAYIPFSGGSRVCLGKNFAMMEMQLVLGTLLQRVDPVIPEGWLPDFHAELSMHPRDGMPTEVHLRNEAPEAAAS